MKIPFVIISSTPKSFVTDITPSIAQELLGTMKRNRSLKEGVAERYGRDMKAGNWMVTNESIGFAKDGQLIDCQHRLWACIDAGVNFKTMVTIGLDEDAREVINTGLSRSIGDVHAIRTGERMSALYVGTGRFMMSTKPDEQGRTQTLDFLDKHKKAITFATTIKLTRGITSAAVLAPIGRAYYNHDEGELERFKRVLVSGMPEGPCCEPIILLRNWLLTKKGTTRTTIYWKTESALAHFLNRRPLRKLYEAGSELFPLTRSRS